MEEFDVLIRIVEFASWMEAEIEAAKEYPDIQHLLKQVEERYIEFFQDYIRLIEEDDDDE